MRNYKRLISSGLLLLSASSAAWAVDTAGTDAKPSAVAPATRPSDPKVMALIDKLGDADATAREEATKKLLELGKGILPELQEGSKNDDPEIRSRVRSLIRKAERKLPPSAPPRNPAFGRGSTSVTINNGNKTIEVDDNGYRIKIRQSPTGIVMDVTGLEDDKEVTETYKAKDADELKQNNPEAFALYEKYNGGGAGGMIMLGNNGGMFQGQIQIGGIGNGVAGGPGVVIAPPGVVMDRAKMMDELKKRLDQANIPAEQKQKMLDQIDQAQRQQEEVQERVQKQMLDARKKALEDLKEPAVEQDKKPEEEKKPEPKK